MKRALIIVVLALFSVSGLGQLPVAKPPVFQFKPDLDVYPQNFAIAIDGESRIFLGNANGVLIYDGEHWQHVPVSNGDIVRSLLYDGRGRIYVGGYDGFGYLEKSLSGEFQYYELSPEFSNFLAGERFADIWRIAAHEGAIYFVGLEHLFRYEVDTHATQAWQHAGSFGPIASFQGQVYLQFRGEGIKVFKNGDWQLVPGPDTSRVFLTSLTRVDGNTLIAISPDDTWLKFDGERFTPLARYDDIPHKGSVTFARAINDNTLALTTQLGKVIFLDLATGKSDVIDVANGFLPDLVVSHNGDTLIVDDLGFYAVHWPARWRQINHTAGLAGNINRIIEVEGATYVLSSSGVFTSTTDHQRFTRIDWTDYEAWDLLPLDDDILLFADSYQLQLIDNGDVTILDHSTTARVLHRSTYNPDLVYVGTEMGIQILARKAGGWVSVYRNDKMDNMRVNSIVELSQSRFLVSSERAGLQTIDITDLDSGAVRARRFTREDGLIFHDPARGTTINRVGNEIIAGTDAGLFVYTNGRFEPTGLDGLAELHSGEDPLNFSAIGDQQWAYLHNRLFKKNGHWEEEDISSLMEGAIGDVYLINDQALVSGLGTILVFDPASSRPASHTPPVTLSAAIRHTAGEAQRRLPISDIKLSTEDTRLSLRYAVADFNDPERVVYRSRLMPMEPVFSDWSDASEQSFVTLAPGTYRFEVEARDSLGQVSSLAVPITVIPQWFEAPSFRLLMAMLTIALLLFLGRYTGRRRTRLLKAERDRLEEMVSMRTRELESANKQLDKMAHLDGLTQIPNRRRLDIYLQDVWQQCVERNRVMALAIIDVDHFKLFNDTHGHQAGDELLVELAKLLSRNLRRAEDLVARYGGEEFLVVLPGADEPTARRVIEEMRRQVEDSELGVTISAGLHANLPTESVPVEELIEAADQGLYRSKENGRNQVTVN